MIRIPLLTDDGEKRMIIKEHTVRKYEKLAYYLALFTKSMKSKWDTLVYIDLFSGPGRSKVDGKDEIYPGSPFIALNLEEKFSKYIFCDEEADSVHALKIRLEREAKGMDAQIVEGDANANVDSVIRLVPRASKTNRTLSFCFADPYALENLKFRTIKEISDHIYVDVFVLIPSFMDAKRNQEIYLKTDNSTIDEFLGDNTWRDKWGTKSAEGRKFGAFVMNEFGEQMKKIGYLYDDLSDAETICESGTKRALYHLCLFSKHAKGKQFWQDAMKYTDDQTELDLGGHNG
jgi:three-Cys-motif partner protein